MSLGDDERRTNILTYFFNSKKKIIGLRKGFDNQFYADGLKEIWQSFDAFLGLSFPSNNNSEQRKKFVGKYQPLFETWKMSDSFNDSVKKLRAFGCLMDMSPVKSRPKIRITDIKNLLEVLDFSYRVRSNLNHGSKDVESNSEKASINRALVEFSFKVTYEILEKTLIEEKII